MDSDEARPIQEEPKRLKLTVDTARRLFVLSGNQCAFPECRSTLVNDLGQFVAQIAHIEGVKGERFNPAMNNEQRRAFENVLALCYQHHVETNDEETYTVEVMRKMKADHEAKFAGVIERIMDAPLRDLTVDVSRSHATNLKRMNDVLGWKLNDDDLAAMVAVMPSGVNALAMLPPATRGLLSVVVQRGDELERGEVEILAFELEGVLGITSDELKHHLSVLERYGFASFAQNWNEQYTVRTTDDRYGGSPFYSRFWLDLRLFCERTGADVAAVISGLTFHLLDE